MKTLRKPIALLLSMLLIFSAFSVSAFAEDIADDDIIADDELGPDEDVNVDSDEESADDAFSAIWELFQPIIDFFMIFLEFIENFAQGKGNEALENIKNEILFK